jgi:hypothetical protein
MHPPVSLSDTETARAIREHLAAEFPNSAGYECLCGFLSLNAGDEFLVSEPLPLPRANYLGMDCIPPGIYQIVDPPLHVDDHVATIVHVTDGRRYRVPLATEGETMVDWRGVTSFVPLEAPPPPFWAAGAEFHKKRAASAASS